MLPLISGPAEALIKRHSCLSHHYLQVHIVITQTAASEEHGGGEGVRAVEGGSLPTELTSSLPRKQSVRAEGKGGGRRMQTGIERRRRRWKEVGR